MDKFRVTVIIPAFNVEPYLERAVFSALNQEFLHQIIIVDDASQDNSYELALSLRSKYPIIEVYTHREKINKGLSATRNRGLEFATGNWIQLLDADDELLPGKFTSQLRVAGKNSAFIVGNALDIFPNGRVYKRQFATNPWIALIRGKLGISSANLFKKSTLEEIGGFDENLRTSEEYDVMFRLMKKGCMPGFNPSFLTKIHQTSESLSRGKKNETILTKNWIALRKRIRQNLMDKKQFGLIERYQYSGAVGMFHEKYGLPMDITVEKLLLQLYKKEKLIKRRIYSFLNSK